MGKNGSLQKNKTIDEVRNEQGKSLELIKNMIISMIIFEVGNGSQHTLKRVPEMMDTPPIQK